MPVPRAKKTQLKLAKGDFSDLVLKVCLRDSLVFTRMEVT